MMKTRFSKNIYSSRARGVSWWIYGGSTFADDILDNTHFYLLPSIEYEHWGVCDKEDQSIDISFKWLFWYISITRYHGLAYTRY